MREQALIAAALSRPMVLHEVDVLPEHFASEAHAAIWQTMLDLSRSGEPFDTVTVSQQLGGELGSRVIGIVNDSHAVPASAKTYASGIIEDYQQRMAADIYDRALHGELKRDEAIRALMSLENRQERFEMSIKDAMRHALHDMEQAADAGGGLRGLPSGLADLDKVLGGWQRGDLTVIGARPAMGKTALLLHFAAHCNAPAGLVSAEQPAYQVAQRHVSSIGKVSLSDLRAGKIGGREMQAVAETNRRLTDYWIFDRSSPSITDVERVARRWRHQHGIQILFVDYIQRIRGMGERRHEQVGDVVRSLKTLARDLDIPVVALSQVGRQVEERKNRRPSMGDLSDSSEIEKEADCVITLYRDEVYDSNTREPGVAELVIAKHRHGPTGCVRVTWAGEYVSFGDTGWAA